MILLNVVGVSILLFLWGTFRECIKEGDASSSMPWMFLLSNKYYKNEV